MFFKRQRCILSLVGCVTAYCLMGCQHASPLGGAEEARESVGLVHIGRLPAVLPEASGMVLSSNGKGLWLLNDSGNEARLHALDMEGKVLSGDGVKVLGAVNRDWEALASDGQGRLYIGDIGDNLNQRSYISVYQVREPAFKDESATVEARFDYVYPEKGEHLMSMLNFDAEALFWFRDELYLLTKHRGDADSVLYRLPLEVSSKPQAAQQVRLFKGLGQVTGADVSPDGRWLAVLTYERVWLFETAALQEPERLPAASFVFKRKLPVEAVAFRDNKTLFIASEDFELFTLTLGDFSIVEAGEVPCAGQQPYVQGDPAFLMAYLRVAMSKRNTYQNNSATEANSDKAAATY